MPYSRWTKFYNSMTCANLFRSTCFVGRRKPRSQTFHQECETLHFTPKFVKQALHEVIKLNDFKFKNKSEKLEWVDETDKVVRKMLQGVNNLRSRKAKAPVWFRQLDMFGLGYTPDVVAAETRGRGAEPVRGKETEKGGVEAEEEEQGEEDADEEGIEDGFDEDESDDEDENGEEEDDGAAADAAIDAPGDDDGHAAVAKSGVAADSQRDGAVAGAQAGDGTKDLGG